MTYVISDIRGYYRAYRSILEQIELTDKDLLYVLGNSIDYGPDSIEVLKDLSMRTNVLPVLGEAEYRAYKILSGMNQYLESGERPPQSFMKEMAQWVSLGGEKTLEDFRKQDSDMQEGLLDFLGEMPVYEEVEVKGKKYLLVHAGIAHFSPEMDLEACGIEDFIGEPLDFNRTYFTDRIVVAGHTPTSAVPGAEPGKIYRTPHTIAMNAGVDVGGKLACLCLETGVEYYAHG